VKIKVKVKVKVTMKIANRSKTSFQIVQLLILSLQNRLSKKQFDLRKTKKAKKNEVIPKNQPHLF
jgi:ribosomal protein L19